MAEVSFQAVSKVYNNDVVAVQGLDLDVGDGELLVIVGPSGCGKTTTLRKLAGLEDITSGKISIADRVDSDLTVKERDIAMVFQSYALYPHLTIAENLGYPLRMSRMPKKSSGLNESASWPANFDLRNSSTASPANSRAGNVSGSPWVELWFANRKCSSWTSRRRLHRHPADESLERIA